MPPMWESTRLARAKDGQGRSENLKTIIITAAVFVFLPLIITAVLFVSIVWTHRPDLSVMDIGREVLKEIKNSRAGKNRQARITWQKGKTV